MGVVPKMRNKTAGDLVAELARREGGYTALGRLFGVRGWSVQKWRRSNSIPPARIAKVIAIADAHGLDVMPWHLRPDAFPRELFRR